MNTRMNISRKAYDNLVAIAASFEKLKIERDNLRKAYNQVNTQDERHVIALNDELKIVVDRLGRVEASNHQLSQENTRLFQMAEANRKLVDLLSYSVDNYNRLEAELNSAKATA